MRLLILLLSLLMLRTSAPPPVATTTAPPTPPSMAKFTSAAEFDAYAKPIFEERRKRRKAIDVGIEYGTAVGLSAPSTVAEAAPSGEMGGGGEPSITNVQEAGVDEGGIVKVYRDYLIMLRRGRLFTVRLRDAGNAVLTPISRVDTFPQGLTSGDWYDEMLIHDDRVIVIGYSYRMRATEIELFRINAAGKITHEAAYFLDSNDYYSSRNYTSRLVGGKLLFYMPYYLEAHAAPEDKDRVEPKLPGMRRWIRGEELEPMSILSKVDIYKPVQETDRLTLHTVVSCDLAVTPLSCSARAVVGPYARSFYVSPNAVHLWISEGRSREGPPRAFAYRLSLTEDAASVVEAQGTPNDQFSFKEQASGDLYVLVSGEGHGDVMWAPELGSRSDLALARVPLAAYGATPQPLPKANYIALPEPKGVESGGFQNRFVGDYVLYGAGGSWFSDEEYEGMDEEFRRRYERPDRTLYLKRYASDAAVATVPLNHTVDRIEVLGDAALVIGQDGKALTPLESGTPLTGLTFTSVTLGDQPAVADQHTVAEAQQGESRSHGFFFSSRSDGGGTLGLPIVSSGGGVIRHLIGPSASVLYLDVDAGKRFTELGSLRGKSRLGERREEDDDCKASCVDWYGNSRPIFLFNRVFALLGYELVEGEISSGAMKETRRVNFLTPTQQP
jgi:hypothetical protein